MALSGASRRRLSSVCGLLLIAFSGWATAGVSCGIAAIPPNRVPETLWARRKRTGATVGGAASPRIRRTLTSLRRGTFSACTWKASSGRRMSPPPCRKRTPGFLPPLELRWRSIGTAPVASESVANFRHRIDTQRGGGGRPDRLWKDAPGHWRRTEECPCDIGHASNGARGGRFGNRRGNLRPVQRPRPSNCRLTRTTSFTRWKRRAGFPDRWRATRFSSIAAGSRTQHKETRLLRRSRHAPALAIPCNSLPTGILSSFRSASLPTARPSSISMTSSRPMETSSSWRDSRRIVSTPAACYREANIRFRWIATSTCCRRSPLRAGLSGRVSEAPPAEVS